MSASETAFSSKDGSNFELQSKKIHLKMVQSKTIPSYEPPLIVLLPYANGRIPG